MVDAAIADTTYHELLVCRGFLGIALRGRMPKLQDPGPISDVFLGAGYFLGTDTTGRAVNREL